MNRKTLTAIKGSIRKWEKIVDGTGVDEGIGNCPLCALFADYDDCAGCPVAEKSGLPGCMGTPYDEWQPEWVGDYVATPRRLAVAKKELRFLKSLLPKDKKR